MLKHSRGSSKNHQFSFSMLLCMKKQPGSDKHNCVLILMMILLSTYLCAKGLHILITATNDVQSAAADTTNGTNNEFTFTGEFIESTTAQGCFVVLECEYGNPDVFRALLLPDEISISVKSTILNILSSKYNMFVYDLEEDGRPNSHPAVEQSTTITVVGNGECLLICVHLALIPHSNFYCRSLH